MDNFDFDEMKSYILMEQSIEELNRQLSQLQKTNPGMYALFNIGRMLGRCDIVRQLLDIVTVEEKSFREWIKKV